MAPRVPRTPGLPNLGGPDVRINMDSMNRALYQQWIDFAYRINLALMKDGTERMEAPLPFRIFTTATLPAASLWEGAIVYDTTINLLVFSDGTNWLPIVGNARTQGKTTLWVPASQMYGGATSVGSAGSGGTTIETRDFDPTTQEFLFFTWAPPKSWDEGTLSAQVYWAHAATATNFGVRWGVLAGAYGDDDALANVYTGAEVSDVGGTTDDLYITAEFGSIDPGNTQVEGDLLALMVSRVTGHADDTLAIDAKLIGVKLFYTTNAPNDA